ncbi:MAG: nitroreductase family protein [Bifidobacterium sp.]|nr:nitroreductase family protein [Bifidobacterium sp.]
MDIKQAVETRHMVRKYRKEPLTAQVVEALTKELDELDQESGLYLTLVTGTADGVNPVARMMGKNVDNYIALAGPDSPDLALKVGYYGAEAMLVAQTLGLNSWWIGGLFSEKGALRHVDIPGAKALGVLVVGYGETQGEPHKTKTAAEIATWQGPGAQPQWFTDGVDALLKAPSALDKQPYTVIGEGDTVSLTCPEGHFADVDRGIGMRFFEIGAGKDHFTWKK